MLKSPLSIAGFSLALQLSSPFYVFCVCTYEYADVIIFLSLCHLSAAGSFPGDLVSLEEYWRELAEQRRQALADTLMENEEVMCG